MVDLVREIISQRPVRRRSAEMPRVKTGSRGGSHERNKPPVNGANSQPGESSEDF